MTEQKHDTIMQHIPKGKENAVCRPKLADVLHTSKRNVSQLVLNARLDGYIIASDNDGYYIPITDEELENYYKMHRKRAIMELASLKTARREMVRRGLKPDKRKPGTGV